MGTRRIWLAHQEDIWCEDKHYQFNISHEIYSKLERAEIHLDIDPQYFMGIAGSQIVNVTLNGMELWEGVSEDKVDITDISPTKFLEGENYLFVELKAQTPACMFNMVGRISVYVDLIGDFESNIEPPPNGGDQIPKNIVWIIILVLVVILIIKVIK